MFKVIDLPPEGKPQQPERLERGGAACQTTLDRDTVFRGMLGAMMRVPTGSLLSFASRGLM